MALHNIKIVVVDGGRSGSYKSKNTGTGEKEDKEDVKDTPLYKLMHLKERIRDKLKDKIKPIHFFAMNYGLNLAGQMVRQGFFYHMSDKGSINGDSQLQATINRDLEVFTDALGVLGGAWSGGQAGSIFGGVGVGVGVVAGLTSSAISLSFKYAERERSFNYKMFRENNSLQYQRARANINLTTGRLR